MPPAEIGSQEDLAALTTGSDINLSKTPVQTAPPDDLKSRVGKSVAFISENGTVITPYEMESGAVASDAINY